MAYFHLLHITDKIQAHIRMRDKEINCLISRMLSAIISIEKDPMETCIIKYLSFLQKHASVENWDDMMLNLYLHHCSH